MIAMLAPAATPPAVTQQEPGSANESDEMSQQSSARNRAVAIWRRFGAYAVAASLLFLGYLHYAPGAAYSLSAEHYRAWAFPAFRYSDLIWLYLRDGLDQRPLPYVDYPLEYPALTGLLSWLSSWTPDLPSSFTLTYTLLAACALLAIWALQRLNGANAWLFAASPALFLYTGHQWDMAAVGIAAAALLAFQRGRDGWGVTGLVFATSMKLFPVVFVAAAVVERVRDRRYRSAAAIALAFAGGTVAINLPIALANFDGWSYFFRWNRDRLADSGIWVLWRGVPTEDLTRWSLVAAIAGGVTLTVLAIRSRGPILVPLGATYLLWWLLVNKTFTTHLMLWVFLAIALLGAPWWLWGMTGAVDLVGFQLGNYLNLYNVTAFQSAPLIRKAVENIYDPMQIFRSAVLFGCTVAGVRMLQLEHLRSKYVASLPLRATRSTPVSVRHDRDGDAATPLTPALRLLLGIGLVLTFTGATALMTWPIARHLGSATIVGFDPYLQIWLSEWIQHALWTNPLGLYDANIFYPFTQTLAYTDANVPGALIAMPLRLLFGDPILTNSLLLMATFVLAASGVYASIAYLTGNRGAALVSGLAYAFLPYRMVHLWHLNWLEGALLPWMVLALIRLIDRPSIGRGVGLGLLTAILVLTSFYFSVQVTLIFAVVAVAWSIGSRQLPSRDHLQGAGVAVVIALAIAVPLFVPYLQVRAEQRLERTIADAEQYKAVPGSYLQLAPWDAPNAMQQVLGVRSGPNESLTEVGQAEHADGHQHAEVVIEDALYPGAVAAVFALVGFAGWRSRRWLTFALASIGLIAVVLSLGPTLGPRHADGPPLPYGWLFDRVPFFGAMRVPARLGGLANLMVVLLAGLGLAFTWQRLRVRSRLASVVGHAWAGPLLTLLVAVAVLADLWTGAVHIETVDRGPDAGAAAKWLATQPPGPVMEFPAESVFADPAAASVRRHYGETMFWSTVHWHPLVNGNSGFIPRAYSDFIERFVGEVDRRDGSSSERISHLDPDTARLLQQLGVRYLVFHPLQYEADDWEAVAAELESLVETGVLAPAGQHGEAVVYLVNPAVPAAKPPRITIYAPTLITPDSAWAPWIALESPSGTPAVLALTRPRLLETTWYDDDGKRLWSGTQRAPLPVVLEEPYLLCGAAECLTARPFGDMPRLPPPDAAGGWLPTAPGHYIVILKLSGDQPFDCRVDLDLVANVDDVWDRSREDTYRWAKCIAGHPNPVNNPGAVPFDLSPPSVTFIEDTAVLDIAVTPRRDEEIRGWFTLAPPGASEPWNEAVYQSTVLQKLLPGTVPTAFEWQVSIGPDVDPGVYGLTVWFHRRGPDGWEHAAGGDIDLAPVVVGDDRTLRWAGPIRVRLAALPEPLPSGAVSEIGLAVSGTSNQQRCSASWKLFSDPGIVASGNAGTCDRPEIALPSTVAPGRYRLQIDAFAARDDVYRLSDAVSITVTVIEPATAGTPS